jgi:RNA polymerase sigma-70 factor (ECF subfamily)
MEVEARVMAALRAGDERGAATEAIRGYGPRILGYLVQLLRDEDDAADAFALFAEQLWKGLPRFERRASLKTWAFKVAWSAAMHVRDDAWRRLGRPLRSSEASRLADDVRTTTAVKLERQRRELEELKATLTPEEQTLLVLRLDQKLSWEDVAEVLSQDGARVDPAALRKRYERIKARLAALVKKRRE